ncbi:hypothetical protein [Roseisolibacter sp. H3M3-2]|uniref:hypothetical protein n=1 Tax=Roseisolibacter sp. H3M3-2 TaxID=3031323 RepID=UPI0023D98512|nr:hypothetical protein [Roseisolibacter sp. H3M3-2]MDF1505017.1 hypothetical protein [Roseisolibacter sp. H3M3-2]
MNGETRMRAEEVEQSHLSRDHPSQLLQGTLLDAGAAWRADCARRGVDADTEVDTIPDWWLELSLHLARIGACAPEARAELAHRASVALSADLSSAEGAEAVQKARNALVAWQSDAPELAEFRDLLRAIEHVEAGGALLTAYTSLLNLMRTLPAGDLRAGYARAQSARVLRTLGLVSQAECAFENAIAIASIYGDRWLLARARLGIGVLLHGRGAYPLARLAFRGVLELATDYSDLAAAAHLGLVSVARAEDEYDSALSHGWAALELTAGQPHAEAEALAVLASLSLDVGDYAAARSTCLKALARTPRMPTRQPLVRSLVQAALGLNDTITLDAFFPELEHIAESSSNPWEQSHALRVAGSVHVKHGRSALAAVRFQSSLDIARQHGYTELEWLADQELERSQNVCHKEPESHTRAERPRLSRRSTRVLKKLEQLSVW